MNRSAAACLLFVLPILFGLVALPVLFTLHDAVTGPRGFTLETVRRFFDPAERSNLLALWNSVWLSLASVALAGLVGTGAALALHRFEFPLGGLVRALSVLPLLLPPVVGVLAFKLFLVGEYAYVPRVLGSWLGRPIHLDGFAGVLFVHTYAFFPFFLLFVGAALQRLEPSLVDAGRSLGAGGALLGRRIVLPLLRPALVGASILVLLQAMGSFSAPLFFAPTAELLTLRIYYQREADPRLVSAIATVLALAALVLLLGLRRFERGDLAGTAKGSSPSAGRSLSGAPRAAASLVAFAAAAALLAPHFSLVFASLTDERAARIEPGGLHLTLDNYRAVLSGDRFLGPLAASLTMATVAAIADVAVGAAVAWLLARGRLRGRRVLEVLAFLPMALPAAVLAFALARAFSRPWPPLLDRPLAGTALMLPLAYFVRHLPITVRATQSALAGLDPQLLDAARSLGAGTLRVASRVAWPILRPGVLAGGLLALLAATTEFVASILLYTPNNKPIAVEIYDAFYDGSIGRPAALSVLLLVVQAGLAFFVERRMRGTARLTSSVG